VVALLTTFNFAKSRVAGLRLVLREQQRKAPKRNKTPALNVGISELFRIAVSGACASAFWGWDPR
jgi:hypothetical protein